MGNKKYVILEKDRVKFTSLVLLNEIIQYQHYFPLKLRGDDLFLEPFLKAMLEKGFLRIDKNSYVPTEQGRNEIVNLYDKYTDYLKMYDIYCAVDLSNGEFAFSSMARFDTTEEGNAAWGEFLSDPRFSDVRVAVTDFKKIDPTEVVFMSFLNEARFNCDCEHWQNELTTGAIWNEIEEICNTAITVDYLVSEGVIENIIKEGTKVCLAIIKQADEEASASEEVNDEEVVTSTTTTTEEYVDVVEIPNYNYSYWEPYYYDPFYISPLWLAPVLLW